MSKVRGKVTLSLCVLGTTLSLGALTAFAETDSPASLKESIPAKEHIISVADVAGHIVPHRALYNVKLASTKNGSTISDIAGRMYYSWSDDCSAWNVEQKMQVRFYYSEGDVSDTTTSLISREAKDGSSYIYHMSRMGGDDGDNVTRGNASLKPDENGIGIGTASANGKETKDFNLDSATTFPAHHTMQLLANAQSGKRFFAINVFDGADENGLNEISSFIGNPVEAESIVKKTNADSSDLLFKKNGKAVASLSDNPLLHARGWPVRMAFFAPASKTGSPDYEMDMVLLDNGVIKSMTVNYDDFAMTAELVNIEALPASKCSAPVPATPNS